MKAKCKDTGFRFWLLVTSIEYLTHWRRGDWKKIYTRLHYTGAEVTSVPTPFYPLLVILKPKMEVTSMPFSTLLYYL